MITLFQNFRKGEKDFYIECTALTMSESEYIKIVT